MATININLLPASFNIQKGFSVWAQNLKKIFIGGAFLLVFLGSVGILTILLFTKNLNQEKALNQKLKLDITDLQATEQRFFLVKDRAQKIQAVYAEKKLEPLVLDLQNIVSTLPPGTSLVSTDLALNKLEVEFLADSSQSMTQLMTKIVSDDKFTKIALKNFDFNSTKGFSIAFGLEK